MQCNMDDQEKKRLQQIANLSDVIRRKHKILKSQKVSSEEATNEMLKPVIAPLKKLIDISENEGIPAKRIKLEKSVKKDDKYESFDNYTNDSDKNKYYSFNEDGVDQDVFMYKSLEPTDEIFSSTMVNEPQIVEESLNKSVNQPVIQDINESIKNVEPPAIDITHEYLTMLKQDCKKKIRDTVLGVRTLKDGLYIGAKPVVFESNNLIIDGKKYALTKGLLELIFKKSPQENVISTNDFETYVDIILSTNAHRKYYEADGSIRVKEPKVQRYLSKHLTEKTGEGLPQYMM